jgi:multiple sugar transport system ATP-binding protein
VARIQLEGVGKRFGDVVAVDAATLDIADGEFVALLGPSGCGKTTLLRMLAGLMSPSTGRVLLDGVDITHAPPKQRDLAMVFQSYALYPHLTVARNLGFPLRARGGDRTSSRERVQVVAEHLRLTPLLDRRPKELSGGQRQRVALGRAMVREPKAFLMDEPLSNLDAKLRTSTRTELTSLHRRLAATFVYVTHDQVEAMTMANRIVVMNSGRIEQVGTPDEVYDRPASVFVATFLGAPPMNVLPAVVSSSAGTVRISGEGVTGALWPGDSPELVVTAGVRPEHLVPLAPGVTTGTGPVFSARVEAIENLGSEEVAVCHVAGRALAVRGRRPLGLRPGQDVGLACAAEHLHLFDAQSDRRLEWRPEPAREPVAVALPS